MTATAAVNSTWSYAAERMGDVIERLAADQSVSASLRDAMCESLRFQQGAAIERHEHRALVNEVIQLQVRVQETVRHLDARVATLEDPRIKAVEDEVRRLREARVAADASLALMKWALPTLATVIPTVLAGLLWLIAHA